MINPNSPPDQPLDLQSTVEDSRALRWALTGASQDGDAASAVYGTILAASILIASFGTPLEIFLSVIGTGLVFWLAHAHVSLMRRIVRDGQTIKRRDVVRTLTEEWPLVQASLSPAAPLILAMVGIISAETAADLGILICFIGLIAWGIVVARAAKLSQRASIFAVGVNVGLGLLLVLLKAILH
jgi:hypothetical protein